MLSDPEAVVMSLFGSELPVSQFFTNILGAPALNMGVFIGIMSGYLGANLFNRYHDFSRLPQALAFFNGKRFVSFCRYFLFDDYCVCFINRMAFNSRRT
ncbi:PTS system maltose and glucose-specific IIC / IIB component [Vibrio variabilis]|uniref:PTS system maltose and glucose-specific IIC / IIB component n=1 Tax=Vibrio variabilis TaxID=990271 RepID=A0ABQ0JEN0_9VIBR|nr:PTS system maltose and glucose-specific IIC / IIB component [Vibrio variabilis]